MPADGVLNSSDGRIDLVIGLIGAVGTRLEKVETSIRNELQSYAYLYELVKLSALIKRVPGYTHLDKDSMHRRDYYNQAIDGGNAVRKHFNDASGLVQWAVSEIRSRRSKDLVSPMRARCFVIDQLKRPEEVQFLREIYGDMFYCIAVYADEKVREARLAREFEQDRHAYNGLGSSAEARTLVERDHKEKGNWGQNVRSAFVEADYFVRSDEELDIADAISRFFHLVFNKPYISPTKSEIAMMHAKTAALRSVDLSRQIGAAIVSRDGRILSTGCNEVPRAGGGQYWEDDADDKRDWVIGYDANDQKKRQAVVELLDRLNDKFKEEYLDNFPLNLYRDLESAGAFGDTLVDSLIEFGRIVHAEQAAMNAACMDGIAIRDADLYCTTYPCHMCARQIVNTGIRNVFYIEPYPKSQITELYEDSIEPQPRLSRTEYKDRLTGSSMTPKKVYFIPFEGVAPRRYRELFSNKRRKTGEGKSEAFNPLVATPRLAPRYAFSVEAELSILRQIEAKISEYVSPEAKASPSDGSSSGNKM